MLIDKLAENEEGKWRVDIGVLDFQVSISFGKMS